MKYLIVNSVILSSFGTSLEEYASGRQRILKPGEDYLIPTDGVKLPSSRRIDRYTKISGMSALECLKDHDFIADPSGLGIMVASSAGPDFTNGRFIDELFQLGFDLASSGLFSYVVANANAGYISRATGNYGPIVTLQGNNNLQSAIYALRSGNCHSALMLAVDEVTSSSKTAYKAAGRQLSPEFDDKTSATLSEVANSILVKTEASLLQSDKAVGEVIDSLTVPLKSHAPFDVNILDYLAKLERSVARLLRTNQMEVDELGLVGCAHHFSERNYAAEYAWIERVFPQATIINPKHFFGFTHGSMLQNGLCLGLAWEDCDTFSSAVVRKGTNPVENFLILDIDHRVPCLSIGLIKRSV